MSEKKSNKVNVDEFLEKEKSYLADLESIDLKENWAEYREKLDKKLEGESSSATPYRKSFIFLAVAASLVAILMFTFLFTDLGDKSPVYVQHIKATDRISDLVLDDGTQIVLREGSELSVPASFPARRTRELSLSGEAFFDVQKARSAFLVHTSNTCIRVLGTSFNVKEDNNGDVKVYVLDGEVQFYPSGDRSAHLLLEAGQMGSYKHAEGSLLAERYSSENFLSWVTDSLSFNNETLKNVFAALEEYYGVVIIAEDEEILENRITTNCVQQDIKDIMDEIALLFDLSCNFRQDTIIAKIQPR